MDIIKQHKIFVVTPAGRKKYLEILSKYILKDDSIDEWHLWDNCRDESDREYICQLSREHKKITVIKECGVDGTNKSVNKFYKYCRDEDVFYIKMDDDIVYLPEKFGLKLYLKAIREKNSFSWWSPMVINNAICTYLLKTKGRIKTNAFLSAQASCPVGWGSPFFAELLHRAFLKSIKMLESDKWKLENDYEIFLQRFSINTIGFFGDFSKSLGDRFCPLDVDDEEYISATLPVLVGKPGRLVGDIVVAHFSFFTQEQYLLTTNILEEYAYVAGVHNYSQPGNRKKLKIFKHLKQLLKYNIKYILNDILGVYLQRKINTYRVSLNDER